MNEDNLNIRSPHNVIMENRRNLTISGVSDVDSFDEQTIIAFTDLGELTIQGYDLHITKLNIESGELLIDGNICSLSYSDRQQNTEGFFKRLFK